MRKAESDRYNKLCCLAQALHIGQDVNRMRFVVASLLALAGLLLSGCATTPTPIDAAKQAPADRVLAFQEKKDSATATLVVIRDEGYLGGGCYASVAVNGTLAARLNTGELARFYVEPGEIMLRSGWDPLGKGLCGLSLNEWTQRETIAHENETKYFRLSIDQNGKTDIQRADPMPPITGPGPSHAQIKGRAR